MCMWMHVRVKVYVCMRLCAWICVWTCLYVDVLMSGALVAVPLGLATWVLQGKYQPICSLQVSCLLRKPGIDIIGCVLRVAGWRFKMRWFLGVKWEYLSFHICHHALLWDINKCWLEHSLGSGCRVRPFVWCPHHICGVKDLAGRSKLQSHTAPLK